MAGFPKKERQAILDGYLAATDRNMFHPAEFIDWLADHPDNPAYPLFFGLDDEEAARAHRIQMARHWVSGLRITIRVEEPKAATRAKTVAVVPEVREYRVPAMLSPIASRKEGGGYIRVDPDDPDTMRELCLQAARDLDSWLERYGGTLELVGGKTARIREIAALLRKGSVVDAA